MSVSKDQARELAKKFRDISVALGDFRFQNWADLSAAQRQRLEDAEWTLLNYSSDFITTAVGLALNDMQANLKTISDGTAKAKKVIATINNVKDVLSVAAALIVLGGAITSQNPSGIALAAGDLFNEAKGLLEE